MNHHKFLVSRLGITWLMLALTPAISLLSGQALFPQIKLSTPIAEALFWLTSTGTAPYGIFTVLFVLALCYYALPKSTFVSLAIAVGLSLSMSLSTSHLLKSIFEEPRPNLIFLAEQPLASAAQLSPANFYQQTAELRSQTLATALEEFAQVQPEFTFTPNIAEHWIDEVGYAFPSGHSIFAATLVLTCSFYLLLSGIQWLYVSLLSWGMLMGISRMLLGMHWSQDVLFSVLLAAIISSLGIWITTRFCPLSKPTIPQPSERAALDPHTTMPLDKER